MRKWTLWFHKMRGISWPAENRSASQERLCSMSRRRQQQLAKCQQMFIYTFFLDFPFRCVGKYKMIKITLKHSLNYYPDNRVSLLNVFLLWQHVSTVQAVIIRSTQKACYKGTTTWVLNGFPLRSQLHYMTCMTARPPEHAQHMTARPPEHAQHSTSNTRLTSDKNKIHPAHNIRISTGYNTI
jgi:hypothetical protein